MFGGIDLGGTKIQACLFEANLEPGASRRTPTPASSYADLVEALVAQYEWLRDVSGDRNLPLGIGIPGWIEPKTGLSFTANLLANGMPLRADLSQRFGFAVRVENDCKCFALSEANGGAAAGYETAFGLILGTGCGGGVCRSGSLVKGSNGLPGEVGHIGIPMRLAARMNLPNLRCGCGRVGCYETLVSGPGMSALALAITGEKVTPDQIVTAAAGGQQAMQRVFDAWLDLVCELLHTIQLTIDPHCVVLGGGLSRINGVDLELSKRFASLSREGIREPAIFASRYGDSSGARGAAMLAILN
jgi:predicted NBD/HSP70 family sugar kinase